MVFKNLRDSVYDLSHSINHSTNIGLTRVRYSTTKNDAHLRRADYGCFSRGIWAAASLWSAM